MGFSYKRPVGERNTYKNFEVGVYPAAIKKVKLAKTKADKPKFTIIVNGKNEESGLYNLVFGNEFTEKNFNYLLASIEDNGTEIPDIDFDYNEETVKFLTGKNVYIRVELSDWNGELVPTITEFLNEEEFEAADELPGTEPDSNSQ